MDKRTKRMMHNSLITSLLFRYYPELKRPATSWISRGTSSHRGVLFSQLSFSHRFSRSIFKFVQNAREDTQPEHAVFFSFFAFLRCVYVRNVCKCDAHFLCLHIVSRMTIHRHRTHLYFAKYTHRTHRKC